MINVTVRIVLFSQKKLRSGEHPIQLYVYDGKVHWVSLGYSCSVKKWNKKAGRYLKSYTNSNTRNQVLLNYEAKANKIIDDFAKRDEAFCFKKFKALFKGEKSVQKTYDSFLKEIVEENTLAISTLQFYINGHRAAKKFHGKSEIKFSELTVEWVAKFVSHLQNERHAKGHAYLRGIRMVFNKAVKRGFVDAKNSPFRSATNPNGYDIDKLKTTPPPKALSLVDIEKFASFNIEFQPKYTFAWHLFMFSFYQGGINFADICVSVRLIAYLT